MNDLARKTYIDYDFTSQITILTPLNMPIEKLE
jgi:hypothetical protein